MSFSVPPGSICRRLFRCVAMDFLGVTSLVEHDFESFYSVLLSRYFRLCNVLCIIAERLSARHLLLQHRLIMWRMYVCMYVCMSRLRMQRVGDPYRTRAYYLTNMTLSWSLKVSSTVSVVCCVPLHVFTLYTHIQPAKGSVSKHRLTGFIVVCSVPLHAFLA